MDVCCDEEVGLVRQQGLQGVLWLIARQLGGIVVWPGGVPGVGVIE
jgi:hypothetical protein